MYPDLDVVPQNDGSNEFPGAWIGLTAFHRGDDVIFEWIDKSHMPVTYWAPNQPNNTNIAFEPEKTCFFLDLPTGAWANSGTTTCNTPLPYVCKMNIGKLTFQKSYTFVYMEVLFSQI